MGENNSTVREMWRKHVSILVLIGYLISGILLLIFGFLMKPSQATLEESIGIIFLQLGGALIAITLTAFFLSLPDLRNFLSSTLLNLFTTGKIVPHLSELTKKDLLYNLHFDEIRETVSKLEPTLYSHIQDVAKECLSSPYATNYRASFNLSEINDKPSLLRNHAVTDYRLHTHNLHRNIKVPFQFFLERPFPKPVQVGLNEWLEEIKIEIGEEKYDLADVVSAERDQGDSVIYQFVIEREIEIKEYVDVYITTTFITPRCDPVEIRLARYPCQGFKVSLRFLDDLVYDWCWFVSTSIKEDTSGRGRVHFFSNGITASTNEWVLPGEGVLLYYYSNETVCNI